MLIESKQQYQEVIEKLIKEPLLAIDTGKEIWRPVVEYKGFYEVSNLGRIRSVRNKTCSKKYSFIKPHIVYGNCGKSTGYYSLFLSKNGKSRCFTVHRLVAKVFIKNINKKKLVLHKDGNSLNNYATNLYWGTSKENAQDALKHNTFVRGEKNGGAKLTEEKVLKIRKLYNSKKFSYSKLGKLFKVHYSTISYIISRKLWKHI